MITMIKNRDIAITVRCDADLHKNALCSAEKAGQSLVEWIRRAMQEKLDREKRAPAAEDDEVITRAEVMNLIAQALAKNAGNNITQVGGGDFSQQKIKIGK